MFDLKTVKVEALQPHHDRAGFRSGVDVLDRYLALQAGQDARKNITAPFVALVPEGPIVGYYTLAASSVPVAELPLALTRKLPRYPLVPATLLGRLAVDSRWRGKGLGRHLLGNALLRATRSEIASFAIVVDAKDESAADFYRREGFLPFPQEPMRLFLPMATIRKAAEAGVQ